MPEYSVSPAVTTRTDFGVTGNRGGSRANISYRGVSWRPTSRPEYLVYIYNVSVRTFNSFGKLDRTKIPGVTETDPDTVTELDGSIGHLGNDRRIKYVTSFPQPILLPRHNPDSEELQYDQQDAVRFVVDLINPDNLTQSLDIDINSVFSTAEDRDLSKQGVFFSLSNPPKREDVEKAYARMEKYYRGLLEMARILEQTNKPMLHEKAGTNPDFGHAAAYYGETTSWQTNPVRPVACSNCGENKPAGKKFHMTTYGIFCVEPTIEGWKAAVNSGMRTYDQVPEELRWREAKQEPVPAPAQPTEENTRPSRR